MEFKSDWVISCSIHKKERKKENVYPQFNHIVLPLLKVPNLVKVQGFHFSTFISQENCKIFIYKLGTKTSNLHVSRNCMPRMAPFCFLPSQHTEDNHTDIHLEI